MGLLRRIRAILEQSPSERDPRDVVIEQQDREISRLRDELARHKGVHRQNGGLHRQIERLERENEHLKQQLGAERRAGRRQAAPFAKKRPQGRGGRPGRRPGARYGRQGRRPCPARVDETIAAPAPTSCPDCGGAVEVTGAASQYQEDLPPVRPVVRRFDIEVGHCSQCRRRIQGRHALQTSDALGAARAQLGPGVVALVVELHTHGGLPLAKVADLLQTRFGLQVTPGGLANLLHRASRDARPAYEALREQVRNAPVVTADETGWRVGARSHWLWAAVTPTTTVYAICAGRGFEDAQAVLGADFDGVLVRDGWVVYRRYINGEHQTCLQQYPDIRIMPMSAQTPPLQAASAPKWSAYSQPFEEGQERVGGAIATGADVNGGGSVDRAFFQGEVGMDVDVGRVDVFVSEPQGDDGGVDSGVQ